MVKPDLGSEAAAKHSAPKERAGDLSRDPMSRLYDRIAEGNVKSIGPSQWTIQLKGGRYFVEAAITPTLLAIAALQGRVALTVRFRAKEIGPGAP